MSNEIRMSCVVRLPDGAADRARQSSQVAEAWENFITAVEPLDAVADYTMGPAKRGRPRRSRPRLATVPDSAA